MNDGKTQENETPRCPHCGSEFQRWATPEAGTWDEQWHWVCFNDDCSYYKKGWAYMATNYNQRASYRFRLNPVSGATGPLPVWSPTALKDSILPDDGEEEGK